MRLKDSVVVIAGAGRGIGRVIALAFAAEGAAGALAGAVAVRADVTRSGDMRALVEQTLRDLGRLDGLVTCAGLGTPGLPSDQDEALRTPVPQRRMIEPEEIANVAVFLALPESAGITGQALNVDGGFVMS